MAVDLFLLNLERRITIRRRDYFWTVFGCQGNGRATNVAKGALSQEGIFRLDSLVQRMELVSPQLGFDSLHTRRASVPLGFSPDFISP